MSEDSVSLLWDLCSDQSRGAAVDKSNRSIDQQAADKSVGEVDQVQAKMKCLHKINGDGETQLHRACRRIDVGAVKALFQAGINVNMEDYAGWTALHKACVVGDEAVVQELLKAGANINAHICDGVTPLHDAVSAGNDQVLFSDRALSDSILRGKGEGNPPLTHAEDPASSQEELSTAEAMSMQDVRNIKFIHLVGDEERLPNALMDIYWDRVQQKDSDDWGPL